MAAYPGYAPQLPRPPYTADEGVAVARQPVRFGGVDFEVGSVIPESAVPIGSYLRRVLYETSRIDTMPVPPAARSAPPPAAPPPAKPQKGR